MELGDCWIRWVLDGSHASSVLGSLALLWTSTSTSIWVRNTMIEEWAYITACQSSTEGSNALADWIHTYNHHRHHTAIGGPPISRVNDLPGHYS